jgi:hypothetical protein
MIRSRMLCGLMGGLALVLVGCEASPRAAAPDTAVPETPAIRPTTETPVVSATRHDSGKPDVTRLEFDANRRMLKVYPLEERTARWMLSMPGLPMGVPVSTEYELPASLECDFDQVMLFYTLPNRRPSPGVSLREIIEVGGANALR